MLNQVGLPQWIAATRLYLASQATLVPVPTPAARRAILATDLTQTQLAVSCGIASLKHSLQGTATKTKGAASRVCRPKAIIVPSLRYCDVHHATPALSARQHGAPAFPWPGILAWRPAGVHPPTVRKSLCPTYGATLD